MSLTAAMVPGGGMCDELCPNKCFESTAGSGALMQRYAVWVFLVVLQCGSNRGDSCLTHLAYVVWRVNCMSHSPRMRNGWKNVPGIVSQR